MNGIWHASLVFQVASIVVSSNDVTDTSTRALDAADQEGQCVQQPERERRRRVRDRSRNRPGEVEVCRRAAAMSATGIGIDQLPVTVVPSWVSSARASPMTKTPTTLPDQIPVSVTGWGSGATTVAPSDRSYHHIRRPSAQSKE